METGVATGADCKVCTASVMSSTPMSPRLRIAHIALATSAKTSAGATSVASLFKSVDASSERLSLTNHFTTTLASTT